VKIFSFKKFPGKTIDVTKSRTRLTAGFVDCVSPWRTGYAVILLCKGGGELQTEVHILAAV
jgi:hypothetical protein